MTTDASRVPYPVPPAVEHPELEAYRKEFPILQRKTYLNSCSLGALSQRGMARLAEFTERWNEWGAHAWYEIWLGELERARRQFAAIIGAEPHEVALAPNVSVALGAIASAFDYRQRNKVVLADMDFPTLAYQWLAKRRLGVECVFVESPDRICTPPELFEEKVDERTLLVATSRVFYTSGYIQDVRAVADIAHKQGAYLLIDDYQGTGQIPIDVEAMDIDILVSGTLKWLMGGPGLAFVYIREGLLSQLEPTIAGWFGHRQQFQFKTKELEFRPDAARIELGTPAVPSVYVANAGMEIVREIGVETICERTRYLTNDLIARARERGWQVRAPHEPERRNSIVMLEMAQPEQIVAELIKRNIIVDSRPGLVRISPYFYNTIEENAMIIAALEEILEERGRGGQS
ncbi:MAG: aminotransferase class V-fold PLP-dependent enzyme [Thermogemmatispora sp.]|jgi:kynureninase|uniref:aminotransferase class V-fold PLP-dependent enzyme n=1 Tax=Thermogemmatispora sp. TaxID=1968838 RepID=UPI0019FC3D04|nr:aminotransferase class V-fold PLP-dependent enzyme [Thermogemmatispora sp.]MBE3566947.1 aminotransferase class V-fold PLP-dependent enzyme [Thermogemmatispora sp.]